jgi:hypothetical protein
VPGHDVRCVERIFSLKGRPLDKHCRSLLPIGRLAAAFLRLNGPALAIARKFWPGPLSIVTRRRWTFAPWPRTGRALGRTHDAASGGTRFMSCRRRAPGFFQREQERRTAGGRAGALDPSSRPRPWSCGKSHGTGRLAVHSGRASGRAHPSPRSAGVLIVADLAKQDMDRGLVQKICVALAARRRS